MPTATAQPIQQYCQHIDPTRMCNCRKQQAQRRGSQACCRHLKLERCQQPRHSLYSNIADTLTQGVCAFVEKARHAVKLQEEAARYAADTSSLHAECQQPQHSLYSNIMNTLTQGVCVFVGRSKPCCQAQGRGRQACCRHLRLV